MIKVFNETQDLLPLKEEWIWLCQHSGTPITPFQQFDYIRYSWEFMCANLGQLHVIVIIRQKDKLVQAIFPCYIDKKKCLRFINDRHSDFCSAIIHRDFIDDYHLYEEFYEYYLSNKYIKRLQFINIREDNPMFANLAYFLKGSINRVVNMYSDFPISSTNNTQASFVNELSRLNTKEKYRLKNVLKKTTELSLRIYDCREEPFPETVINGLIQQMIISGLRTDNYFSAQMVTLFKSLYNSELLKLFVTYNKEQPIAANLFFYTEQTRDYIDWISLYIEKRNNLYNLLQAIEFISHDGGKLNFARGTYEYKMHNFRPSLHFLHGIYHSKSEFDKFCDLLNTNCYYLRQIAKSILRK